MGLNNLAMYIPRVGHCLQVEMEFKMLVFCGGRKPEDQEKNPRNKEENQHIDRWLKICVEFFSRTVKIGLLFSTLLERNLQ